MRKDRRIAWAVDCEGGGLVDRRWIAGVTGGRLAVIGGDAMRGATIYYIL